LKRLALVAPPAFGPRDRRIEITTRKRGGAGAVSRLRRGMIRAERNDSLDPQFEALDDGGLIEGRADMRERNPLRSRLRRAPPRPRGETRRSRNEPAAGTFSR
jgi:hypothetical protein